MCRRLPLEIVGRIEDTVFETSVFWRGLRDGRRKLSAIFWVGASRCGRQHFVSLTINFDDMHRILDIFFIKAKC